MSEAVVLFMAGIAMSAIVSYFTAHSAVTSRIASLESGQENLQKGHEDLKKSMGKVEATIHETRRDVLKEMKEIGVEIKDEIRTYYQRKP